MGDEERSADYDEAEVEREALSRHSSLAAAIGRAGGGDLMKGASPVTAKRQAELEIEHFLEAHLEDADGALLVVLQRRVRESGDLLATSWERPLSAVAQITEYILASEERLRGFVRDVDAEWGRIYLERPHFQRPGQAPHRDDPYTFSSVREALTGLMEELGGEGAFHDGNRA